MGGLSNLGQRSPALLYLGGLVFGLGALQVLGMLAALLPEMVDLHEATVNEFYRLDVSVADTAPCTAPDCTFAAHPLKSDQMPGIKAELVLPPPVMLRPVTGEAFFYTGQPANAGADGLLARIDSRLPRDPGETTRLPYFYGRNPTLALDRHRDWSFLRPRQVATPSPGIVLGMEAAAGSPGAGLQLGQGTWTGSQLDALTGTLSTPGPEAESGPIAGLLFQPVPSVLDLELPASATDNVREGDAMGVVLFASPSQGADAAPLIGEDAIAPGERVPVDGRDAVDSRQERHRTPVSGLVESRSAVADGRFRMTLRVDKGRLSQALRSLYDRLRTLSRLEPGKLRLVVRLNPSSFGKGAAPGFLVPAAAITDLRNGAGRIWINKNNFAVPVAVTLLQSMPAGVRQEPMRVVREAQTDFGLPVPAADWAQLSHGQRALLNPLRHQLLLQAGTHVLRRPPAVLRPGQPLRTEVTSS